ncbi:MAG: hypothetical protein Q7U97_16760 [Rhodocyclaceae bacterium]|nr:hypothetical protein [Rhodocyclaceae bacterium]
MNKRFLPKMVFVFILMGVCTTLSYADAWVPVTNFNTWGVTTQGFGTGSVVPSGAMISLSANGTSEGGFTGEIAKAETSGFAGVWATLCIDIALGNGQLGLKATIGQVENTLIRVYMYLIENSGNKGIQFHVEQTDKTTKSSKLIAVGNFGSWADAWIPGQSQNVAFARFGSELWFYVDGYKQLHKIQLMDGIEPIAEPDVGGYISAYAQNVIILGKISDMYLYYE